MAKLMSKDVLEKMTSPSMPKVKGEIDGMSQEDMIAEIARLKAENAEAKAMVEKGLTMKVSQKGALSIYGLGRFPITLYKEQWLKLLNSVQAIYNFIKQHESELAVKPAKEM